MKYPDLNLCQLFLSLSMLLSHKQIMLQLL
jgi:hypothetical protein